jgi:hypothetical protein
MRRSNAVDLENGVFTKRRPHAVALSLKRSAERSNRRKSAPFRSAMSMLNFHINRARRGRQPKREPPSQDAPKEKRAPRGSVIPGQPGTIFAQPYHGDRRRSQAGFRHREAR